MNISLHRELTRGPWAMLPEAAEKLLPHVVSIITGQPVSFNEEEVARRESTFQPYCFDVEGRKLSTKKEGGYPSGVVAIIPYKDVIVKEGDGCGNMGTEHFAKLIREAAADPGVVAIILDMDTPGGSANAVDNPSAAITEARESKPVLLYAGNGMVASAGYWIGSHADEIYASFSGDQIGSIGTLITLTDYSEYFKQKGIKIDSFYAKKSTEKNRGYRDWKEKNNTDALYKNDLDPFNELFHSAVTKARGEKISKEVFDGRFVFAEQALSYGMIDGIMSFESVINRAFDLAEEPRQKQNKQSMFGKPKYPQLTALIDTKADERNDDHLVAANEELKAAGLDNVSLVSVDEMKQGSDALTKVKADLNTTTTDLTTVKQANTASAKTISDIAAAVGLTEKDGKFTNAAGEELSVLDAVKKTASERDEYGKKSGDIAAADTTKTSEIEAPEAGNSDLDAFYAETDKKINQQ